MPTKLDNRRMEQSIFSDECPFELIHAPNRQNDRIWAPDKSNVPPIELVKHPPKIQVWGVILPGCLRFAHDRSGQTVTADYYVNEVLKKTRIATYKKKTKNRIHYPEKDGTQHVQFNFPTRWCTGPLLEKVSRMVK